MPRTAARASWSSPFSFNISEDAAMSPCVMPAASSVASAAAICRAISNATAGGNLPCHETHWLAEIPVVGAKAAQSVWSSAPAASGWRRTSLSVSIASAVSSLAAAAEADRWFQRGEFLGQRLQCGRGLDCSVESAPRSTNKCTDRFDSACAATNDSAHPNRSAAGALDHIGPDLQLLAAAGVDLASPDRA